ncbi:MAG TPA: L-idonate 5-dehydrogenase [Propionibacterium sp.]|nr:L-idonate 5-dehydrogenase [Propionibacterium sp.]
MKAVVVHAAGDLRVDELPDPEVGPNDVLVEMEWGGVCGSDVTYVRSGVSGTAVLREPLVLGHEVAGTIAALGPDVTGFTVGDRVTVHPATLVGEFDVVEDLLPRTNLWPQVRYFGSAAFQPHEQGGFSRYRIVRPDQVRPLPEGVSTKEGALAEPFGVALHAVKQAGDITGKTVLVTGAGPIGALAVASAKALGAAHVVASDLSETALAIATAMGADAVVRVGTDDLPEDVDVVIEASGNPQSISSVLAVVRRGGTVIQVGNLPGGEVPVALGQLVTREITYRGSYRFVDEINDAIALMDGTVDVSPLMTHEFDINEAVRAFKIAGDRGTGSSKVMLRLS